MRRLRLFLFLAATGILVSLSFHPTASAGPIRDYVLCSCQLCSQSDVDCQISPSGYSIACADYYATHCRS